jgi:hypothetical protein
MSHSLSLVVLVGGCAFPRHAHTSFAMCSVLLDHGRRRRPCFHFPFAFFTFGQSYYLLRISTTILKSLHNSTMLRAASNRLLSAVESSRFSQRLFHASAIDLAKLNVEGLAERVDLRGKNVLVRVDLNVPLAKVRQTADWRKKASSYDEQTIYHLTHYILLFGCHSRTT